MSAEELSLYSGMLRYFILSVTNIYTMIFIMCHLLEKRRSLKVFWLYALGKILIVNIFFCYILPFYIGKSVWIQTISTSVVCVAALLNYVLFVYIFEGGFLRIAVTACGAEILASIIGYFMMVIFNLLEGRGHLTNFAAEFKGWDLGIPVLIISLLTLLEHCLRPFEMSLKGFELKHRKLLWIVAVGYPLLAIFTMLIDARKNTSVTGVIYSIFISSGLLLVIYQIVRKYQNKVCHNQQFLNIQRRLMVVHYEAVKGQINKMESDQQLIEGQMVKISQTNDTVAASKKIEEYLAELKESYEEVRSGIYCDNWMIDAVLCTQRSIFEHRGIHFECKMQKFSLGMIEEQDFIQLLLKLLDLGLKANQETEMSENKIVYIGISAVKNQLIIKFSAACGKKMQIPKRIFREYLKKYSGTVQTGKGESRVSCALSLQRE